MDFTPLLDQARASAHDLLAIVSKPSEFSWAAHPPMSDWRSAAAALALYFGSIFALRGFVKYVRGGRALPGAQFLFGCHNFLMSAMSLLMFVGTIYELTQRSMREGSLVWSACEAPGTKATGALYFWSYMYYLSKFVEFLDTIYLAAKGSELTFFQVYHHSVVVVMCFFWLETAQSLQFGGLLFNTFVHVLMYCYFGLRSFGIEPKWRSLVTKIQIVQFVWSACAFMYTMYLVHVMQLECAGLHAMYFNLAFNMSLLFQFIDLFRSGGKSAKKAKKTE